MTIRPRTPAHPVDTSTTSKAGWASSESQRKASSVVGVLNEVLVSFFDSKQAALRGLALVDGAGREHSWRSKAVVVSMETDGSRSRCEPPIPWPFGAIAGLCLGGVAGSWAGEAGLVVGLFFGLYLGLFIDAWRILGRGDLLDEIQCGLQPGQAALVSFVPKWSAAPIESDLAPLGAVTVHRFPGTPIEEDLAREVAEAVAEADKLLGAERDHYDGGDAECERQLGTALRRLRTIETIADSLLGQERVQFEADVNMLDRELIEARGWRAARIGRRLRKVRASHQRSRLVIEASRTRLRAAAAAVQSNSAGPAQMDAALGRELIGVHRVDPRDGASAEADQTSTGICLQTLGHRPDRTTTSHSEVRDAHLGSPAATGTGRTLEHGGKQKCSLKAAS